MSPPAGAPLGVHGTVLVVDDDPVLVTAVAVLLGDEGLTVEAVHDASRIAAVILELDPDLLLVDLHLPGVRGHDALRLVRQCTDRPIIVLSARDSEADRVLALELGADDYLTKPFSERELVARVRLRLRRPPTSAVQSTILQDGDLVIDTRAREVSVAGRAVLLAAKEFDLLVCLASAPRQVLSREELLTRVWGSSPEWQVASTVTEHIHRLRQKVGAGRIATVRGAGYRFDPAAGLVAQT